MMLFDKSLPEFAPLLTSLSSDGTSDIDSAVHSALAGIRSYVPEEQAGAFPENIRESVLRYLERRTHFAESGSFHQIVDSIHILTVLDADKVRKHCSRAKDNIFTRLVTRMHSGELSDASVSQVSEILRMLLDPQSAFDQFLTYFYEQNFHEMLSTPLIGVSNIKVSPFTVETILDLLGFCVCMHNCIGKAYFLRFGSLLKSLRSILTCTAPFPLSAKQVQLSAIRLVRAFIWQKDPLYLKYLSAFNIPGLILQLVHLHRPTGFTEGNMIYSAALEVVTFLCVNSEISAIESLCKSGSESELLIKMLAEDSDKSHSELAQFMLRTIQKRASLYMCSGGEDLMARHSIGSSRGRSLSPRPLVVPMPDRKRRVFQQSEDGEDSHLLSYDEEEELVPRTPGGSPEPISPSNVKRSRFSEEQI